MPRGFSSIGERAIRAALDEFEQLGRDRFLEKYGFGKALEYFVRHPATATLADSKAIVGAAFGYEFPDKGPLRSADFPGGHASVVKLLRARGFQVATQLHPEPNERQGDDSWSRLEVQLVVADYIQMLSLELAGQAYNKSEHRRKLLPLLNNRSAGSIEFKRRNISAVLVDLGYPSLRGYLPAENAQRLLWEVVEESLGKTPSLDKVISAAIEVPAVDTDLVDFDAAKTPAPAKRARKAQEERPLYLRAVKRDYLEREARNRSLGEAGERFILKYEQWRLAGLGLGQLAEKVRHVSVVDGDGLGYDILSFDPAGKERFIEVKTTAFGELTPFFVSSTEERFARQEAEKFCLCRVFDFRSWPRFFELPGAIQQHCSLDPATYKASLH